MNLLLSKPIQMNHAQVVGSLRSIFWDKQDEFITRSSKINFLGPQYLLSLVLFQVRIMNSSNPNSFEDNFHSSNILLFIIITTHWLIGSLCAGFIFFFVVMQIPFPISSYINLNWKIIKYSIRYFIYPHILLDAWNLFTASNSGCIFILKKHCLSWLVILSHEYIFFIYWSEEFFNLSLWIGLEILILLFKKIF
jgi:hypothetical protein